MSFRREGTKFGDENEWFVSEGRPLPMYCSHFSGINFQTRSLTAKAHLIRWHPSMFLVKAVHTAWHARSYKLPLCLLPWCVKRHVTILSRLTLKMEVEILLCCGASDVFALGKCSRETVRFLLDHMKSLTRLSSQIEAVKYYNRLLSTLKRTQ